MLYYDLVTQYWKVPDTQYGYCKDQGYHLVLRRRVVIFNYRITIWEKIIANVPMNEMILRGTLGDPSPTIARWYARLKHYGFLNCSNH
jgi:hypothetical protein